MKKKLAVCAGVAVSVLVPLGTRLLAQQPRSQERLVRFSADAAALAKEVDKAKQEATRIRADFEAKWRPAVKTAATK